MTRGAAVAPKTYKATTLFYAPDIDLSFSFYPARFEHFRQMSY